jgi:thiol-disulfide isomerase/thioredoxin
MQRRSLLRGLGSAAFAGASGTSLAQQGFELRPWRGPRPALDLPDTTGRRWRLEALQGRVVLVNFWASWCEPCRAEMPSLEQLARRQRDDLEVLAVNFKESAGSVQRFLERTPLDLPVLLDEDGATARAHGVRVFPSTVVVDREGRGVLVVVGEMDWQGAAARELIEPLLARRRT